MPTTIRMIESATTGSRSRSEAAISARMLNAAPAGGSLLGAPLPRATPHTKLCAEELGGADRNDASAWWWPLPQDSRVPHQIDQGDTLARTNVPPSLAS